MNKLIIKGGNKIKGEIEIEGSRNAAMPILAAAILNSGKTTITNIPELEDIDLMIEILKSMGCTAIRAGRKLTIDTSAMNTSEIPYELSKNLNASIIFAGAVLARFGKVCIPYRGGCNIGTRPIDLHLKGFTLLGAKTVDIHRGCIYCDADKLIGRGIFLDFPSIGATENIMMAAVLAEGTTYIDNAAAEPEIVDLQNFLNSMGGKVKGAGTDRIVIEGVKKLHDIEYTLIPDRIISGTYMIAAAITQGELKIKNIIPEHLASLSAILTKGGCSIEISSDCLYINSCERFKAVESIKTLPYPGFPTDLQPQITSLLAISEGKSLLIETIFENRFIHTSILKEMGAIIELDGRSAVITGVDKLTGCVISPSDSVSAAALLLAAIAADGESVMERLEVLERRFGRLYEGLKVLGADISVI